MARVKVRWKVNAIIRDGDRVIECRTGTECEVDEEVLKSHSPRHYERLTAKVFEKKAEEKPKK